MWLCDVHFYRVNLVRIIVDNGLKLNQTGLFHSRCAHTRLCVNRYTKNEQQRRGNFAKEQ